MIIVEKATKNVVANEPRFCGCFISPIAKRVD